MTGHAWPSTQGDSKTRCRKSKVHERHDTHSIRQSRPVRKRAANQRLVPKVTGGQLRLSLTNTYHEWPVLRCPSLAGFEVSPEGLSSQSSVIALALSPDGRRVATGSMERSQVAKSRGWRIANGHTPSH